MVEGFENLAGILMETACASLPQIPPRQKKHYLSEETWQKIEEKEIAISGDWNVAKQLVIDIRKLAPRDKERALLNELERIDRDGYQWEGLKKCRKYFQPGLIGTSSGINVGT